MLVPKFNQWAFTKIFHYEMDRQDHAQKPDEYPFPFKERVAWFCLSVWYRMYCRIAFLCGDWTKSMMWKERGW